MLKDKHYFRSPSWSYRIIKGFIFESGFGAPLCFQFVSSE